MQTQIKDLNKYQSKLKAMDADMPKTSGAKSARPQSLLEESPTKGGKKLANQTSAAQLQVYMKPEFVDFTKRLGPKNP